MSAKLMKQLNSYVNKILQLEQHHGYDVDRQIKDLIHEAAKSLQTRISELQQLKFEVQEQELLLMREKEKLETHELSQFDYSRHIIEEAIHKRKESHRIPNYPIEKNFLEHGPYFAGHKKLNVLRSEELPPEARVIKFEKHGFKALTYQNTRGQLLSLFDTRVFLGLHKLWELNGKKKEFSFHGYELLEILNLSKGGKNYTVLEESLNTLYATSVIMHQFYIKNEKKHIISEKFHLIQGQMDHTILREDEKIRSRVYRIAFSDYLQNSLHEGYVSYISLAMLEDLQTETAQALYLMLNSIPLTKEGYYEMPVDKICKHIGIDENQAPNKIKTTLNNACEQLIKTDIIQNRLFHIDDTNNTHLRMYPTEWFIKLNPPIGTLKEILPHEQLKLLL
ncbi:MAG: replication initiator protein A [Heyndrickxia sp.]